MNQLEAAKEQQRLDAIMNRRAMGLYSSSGGTRTSAATTTTTAPKWVAPATIALTPSTAPRAPTAAVTAASIGTGACALTTTSAASPPPVPPRSPVMAPPPVPPRSPLLEPTTSPSAEAVVVAIDDSEVAPCDDQAYRAKCEKQRLDKYISGEWRLARLLRADSGVTKTKTSSSDAGAERRRERDHKETCDVTTKRATSVDPLETELTLVSLFIDELVHLLRKTTTTTTGYDNAQALGIVRKAKEVKDAAVSIITASASSSSSTARIADDVNALAGAIARLVNGWREGTAVDGEAAGGVASQAAQLQQQLRQLALAQ